MERRNLILKDTLDLNLSPKAFAIPFRIGIEPMKRLLIASFEKDADYEAIEPQLFDDDRCSNKRNPKVDSQKLTIKLSTIYTICEII
jgi:hypothetical protein